MLLQRVVTGFLLASVLVWTGPACAGWVIDQVTRGGGEGGRQQVLLQANRMKTIMLAEDGKPAMAFILDLNTETLTQVDYQHRSYFAATVQEYVQLIQGVQRMASEMPAGVMQELQEQMKDLPAEQRQIMEQAMRAQTPRAASPSTACGEPRIEVRRTGEQAMVAGYPAVRYDVLADGNLQSEVWVAKGLAAWRELDPQKLERFAAAMAKAVPCGPNQGQRFPGTNPAWKVAGEGYPVRMVDRSGGGGTIEVVKAGSRAITAAEFQPPGGFSRKELRELTSP